MRKSEQTVWQKQENFRIQIRRRQIDHLFKLYRIDFQKLPSEQSIKICRNNFRQVQILFKYLLEQQSKSSSSNSHDETQHRQKNSNDKPDSSYEKANQKLQILIKQLKQVNCLHKTPQIFVEASNLALILRLHKWEGLSRACQQFILEILLNISAYCQQQCRQETKKSSKSNAEPILQLDSLNIHQILSKNNRHSIVLMLQILSNLILSDNTSKTIYDIMTKERIYKFILQFLVDKQRRQIYEVIDIKQIFMWFVNRVLSQTIRFKFQRIQSDFSNVISAFYSEVLNEIKLIWKHPNNIEPNKTKMNQMLQYLKTLIKSSQIQLEQELIEKINSLFFSTTNLHYIQYIGILTFHTLYALQTQHLQLLLEFLLYNPQSRQSPTILRCIANSLANDSTNWRIVFDYFKKISQKQFYQNQGNLKSNSSSRDKKEQFLDNSNQEDQRWERWGHYFVYFLNQSSTELDMAQIIRIIICGQGELGLFSQVLSTLRNSDYLQQILQTFDVRY